MAEEEFNPVKSFNALEPRQLELYAKELQQHFREHRSLRKEMDDLNLVLEQRVRELGALNRLFQQHLVERDTQEAKLEAFEKLLRSSEAVTQAGDALVEKTKGYRIPDIALGPLSTDPAT